MTAITLYVGEGTNRRRVDSQEIKAVSITYNLKNIKNYGLRNSSFTKPISILQTKNTREIFGSLFNINKSGGYDTSQKVFADLQENGLTIIKGSLRVTEITQDTYEVVLSTNQGTLLEKLGDKLIRGNIDSSDDLSWPGTPYQHTWTRSHVRDMLGPGVDPSNNGEGYIYPIIQYSDDLRFKWPGFQFDYLYAFAFADDYPVLPAIAAKQIFDRIFESNGYSYTMTEEMEDIFEKMYIPFNDDYLNYTSENWKFGLYYLGNPRAFSYSDTTVELTPWAYDLNWFSSEVQPAYSIKGWTFQDNYLPGTANDVTGGYDYMYDRPADASRGSTSIFDAINNQRFDLPHGGTFQIDVSMWLYNTVASSGDSEWSITTWNSFEGSNTTQIGSVTITGNSGAALTGSVQVTVSTKSFFYVHRSTESSGDINLVFGPWTLLELSEIDSLIGEEPVFDLNNMSPVNYKQKDFINDVLKAFNAYVTIDDVDETKLHIKTFDDFYSDYEYKDWSTKISEPKFKPIKDDFPSRTNFKLTSDNDIFSQDYSSKYPDAIYTKYVTNDSEFSTAENDIVLNFSPGYYNLWKNSDISWPGYAKPPNGYEILKLTDDKQFKTSWKPRLLFAHAQDCSAIPYGSDRYENPSDASIYRLITLTPRMLDDTTDASNCFMGWSSENTYFDTTAETGETLYNKFYKGDIERYLSNDSRLLTVKANLNARDINEGNFNDRIWIENSKIGSGYYIINEIKNYTPGGGLTDVELLRLDIIDDSYDTEIIPNVVFRSLTGPGGEGGTGSGGSGGGSGGGGGSQDLQSVTSFGNETTQGIVFANSGTPSSQVEIDATSSDELLIGGDTYITGDVSIADNANIGGELNVQDDIDGEGDLNIYGDAVIGNEFARGDIMLRGDTQIEYDLQVDEKSYFAGDSRFASDVSIDGTTFGPTFQGEEEFVSGWTGDGWKLYQDDDENTNLEVDNLRVRGAMEVYELILNKIRASNGSLWISDAVEAQWPGDASTRKKAGLYWDQTEQYHYFRCESNLNTLNSGDAILSQQFLGNSVHRKEWWVHDSSGTFIYVYDVSTERMDGDGPGTPDNQLLFDVSCNSFATATSGNGYQFNASDDGAFKTWVQINGDGAFRIEGNRSSGGSGSLSIAVYDASDNLLSGGLSIGLATSGSFGSTRFLNGNTTPGDPSCYILFSGAMASNSMDGFYVDSLIDYTMDINEDITGYTFVRMGNPDEVDRQGALYLTASDTNAPYLEVLDQMVDHNIGNSNRKVRLGKLDGVSWKGDSISGYGLWTEDAYLSGYVNAVQGNIGAWEIVGDSITGIDGSLSINLDAGDQTITFATEDGVAIEIKNDSVTELDDILDGSQVEFLYSYLTTYSSQTERVTSPDSTHTVWSRMAKYASNNLYVDDYEASIPSAANRFDMAAGTYYCNYWVDVDVSVNAPDSSNLVGGKPWPRPTAEDQWTETSEYNLTGGWRATAESKFYPTNTTAISSNTGLGYWGGDLSDWKVISNKNVAIDSSSYLRVEYDFESTFSVEYSNKLWISVDTNYGAGDPFYEWQLLYENNGTQNVDVDFTITPSKLLFDGAYQKTEIGKDGLNVYRDSGSNSRYFLFNPYNNDYDLMIKGDADLELPSGGSFQIRETGFSIATGGTLLGVRGNDTAAGWFTNENTNTTTPGIGVYSKGNGSSGRLITFGDDSAFSSSRGSISHNGTGVIYYGEVIDLNNYTTSTSYSDSAVPIQGYKSVSAGNFNYLISFYIDSRYGGLVYDEPDEDFELFNSCDTRLKANIVDEPLDALGIIKGIKYRKWESKDDKGNIRKGKYGRGYVADELEKVYPAAVNVPEDPSMFKTLSKTKLIPVAIEAIRQQQIIIENLQDTVEDLKKRLEKLESKK